ncbi:MAG: Hsp70 family protein [Candidatus Midichloria sp.]|nr:MAG: Hsp70 family protein [Candidatus Midichloria sp.]
MKLYDITEPSEATLPIGIDLGTTNSLIAVKKEKAYVITDEYGNKILPSVVLYKNGNIVVGKEAVGLDYSISSIKRLIGKGSDDIKASDIVARMHHSSDRNNIFININGKAVSVVEVSAEILKALKQRAEKTLQQPVTKAVITVPAYFDDASRNATRAAAQLAGLEVLRLINEPTAAAIAYGLDKKNHGIFLIYDLGGGTFDISIVTKKEGVMQVIATAGDVSLGGDDFDLILFKLIKEKYQLTNKLNNHILVKVKKIRENLTLQHEWSGLFLKHHINVTQKEFEQAIEPLLKKTIKLVQRALKDAELQKEDIAGIVLVGGATRTPAIKKIIKDFFNKEPLDEINPDEIVALGAADHAYSLLNTHEDENSSLLLDVTPLTLSIELVGGVVEPIIPRNTPIPISVTRTFTNYSAEQTGMKLNILQGEEETVAACRSLGILELKGIPKMPAREARVEITFIIDANGVLTVIACEKTQNIHQEVTLNPTYGLSEEMILELLKLSG